MKSPVTFEERYKNLDNDTRGLYVSVDLTAPGGWPALFYELHGFFPPEGRHWKFTPERMRELESDRRIILSTNGRPRLKRFLNEATIDRGEKQAPDPTSRLELIIRSSMKAIASAIASSPEVLYSVEWRDLERVLREVFDGLGFSTELTRPSKDGGFDLEVSCNENGEKENFLIEVKHWVHGGSKPGSQVVSNFFDVVVSRKPKVKLGLILSSSGFGEKVLQGRTEIERHLVRLGNGEKIISLCQSYVENEVGMLLPTTSLPEILLQGTL